MTARGQIMFGAPGPHNPEWVAEQERKKATPGPWGIELSTYKPGAKEAHSFTLSHGVNCYGDGPAGYVVKLQDTTLPNARLIAAAPDLYEALKALQLQALQSSVSDPANEWGREALDMARAALAKAVSPSAPTTGNGGGVSSPNQQER